MKMFFSADRKLRIEAWSREWLHDITCSCYGFKKHLKNIFLVKILCQKSQGKVSACFVMDSTGRTAAFRVFCVSAHLHSNRRHSLLKNVLSEVPGCAGNSCRNSCKCSQFSLKICLDLKFSSGTLRCGFHSNSLGQN